MNATKAIKTFIAQEPNAGERLAAKELLAFKSACDPEEYQEFGRQAAGAPLGEPFEEKQAA